MNRFLLFLISTTLFGGSFLVSCNNDDSPSQEIKEPVNQGAEKPTDFKTIELTAAQVNTNNSTQQFAYDLLRKSVEQSNVENSTDNIFISPLGVSNILTMLANGADDKTLEEITFAMGANLDQLNSLYTLLADALPKADNQVTFSSANSIWMDNVLSPSLNYMNLIKNNFNADSFKVDLNSLETKDAINQWCSEKTNGMIPEFLKNRIEDGMMFLVNALYFDGKWTKPFDENKTDKGIFYSSNGDRKEVDMMHTDKGINYSRIEGGEMITLYYGNKSYSLNIFLPSEGVTIENALKSNDKYLKHLPFGHNCILSLPKFEVEYENNFVIEILKKMGIIELFENPNSLSKIANDLFCNSIKQTSKLKVTESGAEAAAVTGALTQASAGDPTPQEPAVVIINRPFIFSITETTNDVILFAGVIRSL